VFCTVSHILPLLPCRWLPVTLKSLSVSIRQLKLQATYAIWFTCKHIITNACYVSRGMGVRKVSNSKVTFKVTQGHCYWCHSYDFLLVFHRNYVTCTVSDILRHRHTYYQLYPKNYSDVTVNTSPSAGVICLACDICLHTKFELPSYIRFEDMMGPPKLKNGPHDPDNAHLRVSCHPKANTWYSLPAYKILRLWL